MAKRGRGPAMIVIAVTPKQGDKNMKIATFAVPKGFTPPEGVVEGDTFEAMASFKHGGKTLDLVSIEGAEAEMPEKEMEMENTSKAPAEAEFADAIEMGAMPEGKMA
jgi:hypothetical protein